jgi:hypothetical protein
MKRALAAIAFVSLAVRLVILAHGTDSVDRLFVPDDAYYTLGIARSLAHGLGPTADGVALTSGFQPLLAFLLVPVFWISHSVDGPLYADWLVGVVADVATTVLLGVLAARVGGRRAGLIAAVLWALSSIAIANALNGLETSLAVALDLALVTAWLRARSGRALVAVVACGALAGLALLARIDAVFLVGILGVLGVLERRVRDTAIVAGAALLVVAPWWLYCLVHFGSVIPASGAAVHQIVEVHRTDYLTVTMALGWAAGSVLGSPFVEAPGLCDFASADPIFGVGLWALVVFVGLFATRRLVVRRMGWLSPYTALAASSLCIFGLYSFYLPALWFFRRYFAPIHAFAALCVGLAIALALRRMDRSRAARVALWVVAPAAFLLVVKTGLLLIIVPTGTIDERLHGAKGYRDAAHEVLAIVPRDAVVGAFQSGALAYYADGCPQIVGLDGVVDPNAARAIRDHALADYAASRGVTYFADWPLNRAMFWNLSRAPRASLSLVGAASLQGRERFEVVHIIWPVESNAIARRQRVCGAP